MNDLDARGPIAADLPDWHHAVDSRDPSFDGVFYVAITSTRIYCRPVCPSRLARRENRRFFTSCADAERCGFQSLRSFNAAFSRRFAMSPTEWRRRSLTPAVYRAIRIVRNQGDNGGATCRGQASGRTLQ